MGRINGSISSTNANGKYFSFYIEYSTSTNNSGNYTTVNVKSYYYTSTTKAMFDTVSATSHSITVNGETRTISKRINCNPWPSNPYLIQEESFRVYHNSDGSGGTQISASSTAVANIYGPGYCNASGWVSFPTIPKAAKITSAENFTDEGNPTIKYSNPAGNGASTLQACISFDGYTIEVPYRDIPKTGSSYTFNLTDNERAALLAGCSDAKSKSILFYVKSVVNGTQTLTKIEKTFSVVNAEPVINPTVEDIDTASVAITGDKTKLIKFFSDVKCLFNYELKKGATVSSLAITHNGATKYDNESYWYNVETNVFEFTLTDSRGYTVSKKIEAPLFDYVKLTCNVEGAISTMGNGYFSIKGNYYNGTFGGTENYLLVQYQYKKAGEEYSELQYATASISGNTYSASISIKGLDYRAAYHIRAVAVDSAMTVWSAELVARATPIFDWGENDFNFNVPITIQGRGYGENKILWEGALPMGSNQAINLYGGKISEQPHGIVLIFTGFDEPNPLNQSVCSHFVSKKQVELFGDSVGHTFILGYNATLAKFGAKYLYFSDEQIKGHSGNTTYGGATPGFEIDNTYWCLRYVIGV